MLPGQGRVSSPRLDGVSPSRACGTAIRLTRWQGRRLQLLENLNCFLFVNRLPVGRKNAIAVFLRATHIG